MKKIFLFLSTKYIMTKLQKCNDKIVMYRNPIIGITGSCGKTTTCK